MLVHSTVFITILIKTPNAGISMHTHVHTQPAVLDAARTGQAGDEYCANLSHEIALA